MIEYHNISFVHPVHGGLLIVETVPDNVTVTEVINALIEERFIAIPEPPYSYDSYVLGISGGSKIEGNQTLASGGLHDNCVIYVVLPNID